MYLVIIEEADKGQWPSTRRTTIAFIEGLLFQQYEWNWCWDISNECLPIPAIYHI